MIRPFTCVCVLMAAGSGLYLYQTKHRSQMLDREIARTIKQTETVRERSVVLRGEWALLSEPERLAELSRQHLGLRTLQPTQFAALGDLAARLPGPLPAGSMALPTEEVAELSPLAPARLQPAAVPAKPVQVASLPTPAVAAAVAPTPTPTPLGATPRAAAKPAAALAATAVAPVTAPAARAVVSPGAPIVQVAVAPIGGNVIGESVARVARGLPPLAYQSGGVRAAPMTLAATSIAAIAVRPVAAMSVASVTPAPQMAASAYASAPVGSALGGARSALPAPVPYSAPR